MRIPKTIYNENEKEELMAISKELLEILACPLCQEKVQLIPDGTGLKCAKCNRVFPIRDDIPVMQVEEAKIEES